MVVELEVVVAVVVVVVVVLLRGCGGAEMGNVTPFSPSTLRAYYTPQSSF